MPTNTIVLTSEKKSLNTLILMNFKYQCHWKKKKLNRLSCYQNMQKHGQFVKYVTLT